MLEEINKPTTHPNSVLERAPTTLYLVRTHKIGYQHLTCLEAPKGCNLRPDVFILFVGSCLDEQCLMMIMECLRNDDG